MKTAIETRFNFTASMLAASFCMLGAAMMPGQAQAADPNQAFTAIVSYGDLNLDSPQGAKVLYARLRGAAQTVCASLEGRDLAEKRLWHSCFENAVASAVAQVNKSTVTALHNQMASHNSKS